MFTDTVALWIICLFAAIALYFYNLHLYYKTRRYSVGEYLLWRAHGRVCWVSGFFLVGYLAVMVYGDVPKLLQASAFVFLVYCAVSAMVDKRNVRATAHYISK